MSKRVNGAKVDQLVYEAFVPQKPAKVISVRPSNRDPQSKYVTIKFLDGSTKEVPEHYLNDFEALIEEHKRKYLKFDAVAVSLRKL